MKFELCIECNLIIGTRKRVQIKNTIRTRAAVLSTQCSDMNSPMKKEAKLDDNKNVKNDHSDVVHTVSEAHKSSVCISSFFYTVNVSNSDVSKSKTSIVPTEERFYRSEQTRIVQNDILTDVGHFRTDETPVAVPIHGPSTPHRIKMPNNQLEDLDEGNTNDDKLKKPVVMPTLTLEQQPLKKPANRGHRKLNGTYIATNRSIDFPNTKSTNHKLTDYFPVRRSVRKSKKAVLEEKQRDMENKVLCQVEEGLEVRHFAGKGRGVITTREFTKGEFVVEYIGELIDQITAKKREKIYAQDQNTGCYMYYFQHRNHQYCVDATAETDKLGRLVNHSRNGNLVARVIEVGTTPHLVLTAKENIPIGVEVTYDYGDRSREAIRHHPWLAL
ncbi:Histone-lysine N-methyltransferase pr-set7 [Habropoda laboriosa]|uniref:[histone H4]-lysine(20) N-methyltransferase n=1 Tax=Habropoda laboriosa TaxID=597456 RepID=A0A0L7RBW2_9HYME|nr:Histone-lysine N-methyltransferase pr-set7 [Habropoda laboriosa]